MQFFGILAFLPGSVLVHFIAKKRKVQLSNSDKIIIGFILWNYLLVSSSVIIGLTSPYVVPLFWLFTFTSLVVLLLLGCLEGYHQLRSINRHKLKLDIKNIIVVLYSIPIITLLFIITSFHTIFREFDPIYLHLPLSMSILKSGGISYSPYFVSYFITYRPPALYTFNAWIIEITQEDNFRVLPFLFLISTAFVIYHLGKELLSRDEGLLSTLIFLSFPTTIATMGTLSLYPDVPLVFYIYSTIFFIVKMAKNEDMKSVWLLFIGISVTLIMLTKEGGLSLIAPILSLIVLFSHYRHRRIWFAVLSILPYFLWAFIGFLMGDASNQLYFIPILLFMFLFYLFSKVDVHIPKFDSKDVLVFLLPITVALLFFLRSLICLGSFLYEFQFNTSVLEAKNILVLTQGSSEELGFGLLEFFRWDVFATSLLSSALYICPLMLGLIFLFYRYYKKGDSLTVVVLFSIVFNFLMMWSIFSFNRLTPSGTRRVLYFIPAFSCIIAHGIFESARYISGIRAKIDLKGSAETFPKSFYIPFFIYVSALTWFFLSKVPSGPSFYPRSSLYLIDYLLALKEAGKHDYYFSISMFLFLLISIFFIATLKHSTPYSSLKKFRVIHYFYYFMLIGLVLMAQLPLLQAAKPFWRDVQTRENLRYEHAPEWEDGILEAVQYYNENITDNYITVTIHGQPIIYFANRLVIELQELQGVHSLLPILKNNDLNEDLKKLVDENIRYFLMPKSNNWNYYILQNFSKIHPLFNSIEKLVSKNEMQEVEYEDLITTHTLYRLRVLKEFSFFILIKLEVIKYYGLSADYNQNCESIDGWKIKWGNGTISLDDKIFKQGNASVRITGVTDASRWLGAEYDPSETLDLGNKPLLHFWFRSDSGGLNYVVRLVDVDGWIRLWYINRKDGETQYMVEENQWVYITLPLNQYWETSDPKWDTRNIGKIQFQISGVRNNNYTFWVDQISTVS